MMLLLPICVASEDFSFSFFVSSPVGVSVINRVMCASSGMSLLSIVSRPTVRSILLFEIT